MTTGSVNYDSAAFAQGFEAGKAGLECPPRPATWHRQGADWASLVEGWLMGSAERDAP